MSNPDHPTDENKDDASDKLIKCFHCEHSCFPVELTNNLCFDCRSKQTVTFMREYGGADGIQQVVQGLYITSLKGVNNPGLLLKNDIRVVITLTSETVILTDPSITHYREAFDDNQDGANWCRRKHHFEYLGNAIHMHRKAMQNVLVHCAGGVSRSAAVICYYLMFSRFPGYPYDQAVAVLKQARPIIDIPYYFQALLKVDADEDED